jgi:hypothetical protein
MTNSRGPNVRGVDFCSIKGGLNRFANSRAPPKYSLRCKIFERRNILKATHLFCDIVIQMEYSLFNPNSQGITMSAIAEVLSSETRHPHPRGCDLPTCPVCADSMVAAEASAYVAESIISYLWTCDTCGYGFVTRHALRRFACN